MENESCLALQTDAINLAQTRPAEALKLHDPQRLQYQKRISARTSHARIFTLLMICAGLTNSLPANSQQAYQPQWAKGDSWTYRAVILSDSQFRGKIESREIFTVSDVVADGYEVELQLVADSGLVTERWAGRNSTNAYPITKSNQDGTWSESRWPRWPMEPKPPSTFAGRQRDQTAFNRETVVGPWEEVTVPAGRFFALRITTDFVKGPFYRRETWWYVPAVKRFVRYEQSAKHGPIFTISNTALELVSYSVK